ncbi:hypothetical protein [Halobacteriovorax sp.]|uniref:hypothetical protein n=1 Tax=Halobacteriovorax sp. TaxID=2020862 RepID=UPI003AF26C14
MEGETLKRNFKFKTVQKDRPNLMGSNSYEYQYKEYWLNALIPFNKDDYSIDISPASEAASVSVLFGAKEYDSNNIKIYFRQFISQLVSHLTRQKKLYYEISSIEDNEHLFSLRFINDISVYEKRGYLIQNHSKNHHVSEKLENLFIINEPNWIENKQGFQDVISHLKQETIRKNKSMDILTSSISGTKNHYFDYHIFNNTGTNYVLKLTKGSGWTPRLITNNQSLTSYYKIYRYILFKMTVAKLREEILREINFYLIPKLKQRGSKIESINYNSKYTVKYYEELLTKLESGSISLSEII